MRPGRDLPPADWRVPPGVEGEAGIPVTVVSLPARGRPPEAAARRAGLELVEKVLPTKLTNSDTTERNCDVCLRCPPGVRVGLVLAARVALSVTGRLKAE